MLENPARLKSGHKVSCSLTEAWEGLRSWSNALPDLTEVGWSSGLALRPLRTSEFADPGLVSYLKSLHSSQKMSLRPASAVCVGAPPYSINQTFANLSRDTPGFFLLEPEPKVFV